MAHFAKLDENNIVTQVIVVNNDTLDPDNQEKSGIEFLNKLFNTNDKWKQTSYNASFRKNFAGIGYKYDETFDAFIEPKPYDSWKLNHNTCRWEPPVPMPEIEPDGVWKWSEYNKEWVKIPL